MKIERIGIIGSGAVGKALAGGFHKLGYQVTIGSRDPVKLTEWAELFKGAILTGTFEVAAQQSDAIVLATRWAGKATRQAIVMAGKPNFTGKFVIDVTNPIVFQQPGEPPVLDVGFPRSGGELVQKWIPDAHVVKAFNIITASYMTNPKLNEGTPDMLVCGNNDEAKKWVTEIATEWGWPVHDLGKMDQAYLLEALAMIWIRYGFLNNHWNHAFKLLMK